jgi:hypothetical protein
MKRWALLSGAVCANVVEQADAPTIGGEWLDVTGLSVGPGSRRVNGAWLPPVPAVPQSVTMRQGREVLIDMGLLNNVNAIIAAIPDPLQRAKAENYFNMSNTMERQNVWVKNIGAALGLSETQLDDMFITASTL